MRRQQKKRWAYSSTIFPLLMKCSALNFKILTGSIIGCSTSLRIEEKRGLIPCGHSPEDSSFIICSQGFLSVENPVRVKLKCCTDTVCLNARELILYFPRKGLSKRI
jgi:hypothetical protein